MSSESRGLLEHSPGREPITLAPDVARVGDIACDDRYVYLIDADSATVRRVVRGDTSPTTEVLPFAPGLERLSVDEDSVFAATKAPNGIIWRVAKATGKATQLYESRSGISAIAVLDGVLYWHEEGAHGILRGNRQGAAPHFLVAAMDPLVELVIADGALFWATVSGAGAVRTMLLEVAPPRTLTGPTPSIAASVETRLEAGDALGEPVTPPRAGWMGRSGKGAPLGALALGTATTAALMAPLNRRDQRGEEAPKTPAASGTPPTAAPTAPAPAPLHGTAIRKSMWTVHAVRGQPESVDYIHMFEPDSDLIHFLTQGPSLPLDALTPEERHAALTVWDAVRTHPDVVRQLPKDDQFRRAFDHVVHPWAAAEELQWQREIEVPHGRDRGPGAVLKLVDLGDAWRRAVGILDRASQRDEARAITDAEARKAAWDKTP